MKEKAPVADFSIQCNEFKGFNGDNFSDYTQNPETAIMLYHTNSGHGRFLKSMDLFNDNVTIKTDNLLQVQKEINAQILSPEERDALLRKFAKQQGKSQILLTPNEDGQEQHSEQNFLHGLPPSVDAHILGCGACGKKSVNGMCGQFCKTAFLNDLPKFMRMKQTDANEFVTSSNTNHVVIPINDSNCFKQVNLSLLRSVYHSESLNCHFLLHPELVHVDENKR